MQSYRARGWYRSLGMQALSLALIAAVPCFADDKSPLINPVSKSTAYKSTAGDAKFSFLQTGADVIVAYAFEWEDNGTSMRQVGTFNVQNPMGDNGHFTLSIREPAYSGPTSGAPANEWGKTNPVVGTLTVDLGPGPWDKAKSPKMAAKVTSITNPDTKFRLTVNQQVELIYWCAPSSCH